MARNGRPVKIETAQKSGSVSDRQKKDICSSIKSSESDTNQSGQIDTDIIGSFDGSGLPEMFSRLVEKCK